MLRRLRGSRAESPPPPAAAAELSNESDVVKVAVTKPLTMDEKAAMLTEKVVEIVPGMTMPCTFKRVHVDHFSLYLL
jgi:hypothetical protein